MFRSLFLQIGASILVIVVAGFLVGAQGAISAGLGAFACIVPNALFILRLHSLAGRPGASYPVHFFLGEFVKIVATAGLLAIALVVYPEMHWLSLLAGWVIALQAGFFAFWKKF